MKFQYSIVAIAFASNFIWLIFCADISKPVGIPGAKSLNSTNHTSSNPNSTLSSKVNATLKNEDKKNFTSKIDKSVNLTTKPTPTAPAHSTGATPASSINLKSPLAKADNKTSNNKTQVSNQTSSNSSNKTSTIPLYPNISTTESPRSPVNAVQVNSSKKTPPTEPPNARPQTANLTPGLVSDARPINPAILANQKPNKSQTSTNQMTSTTTMKPETTTAKTPNFGTSPGLGSISPGISLTTLGPIIKVLTGMFENTIKPNIQSGDSPTNVTTEKPTTSTPLTNTSSTNATIDAVDSAWNIVKDEKYNNLSGKSLPKYEIPAADLEEQGNRTGHADKESQMKEAVAKAVKEQMDDYHAKQEKSLTAWEIVAFILLPICLIAIAILVYIFIRRSVNEAKGRNVVYELTSEFSNRNNEKPVIST